MRARLAALTATLLVLTGCTSGGTVGSSGTVILSSAPTSAAAPRSAASTAPASPTPVTPNGLITGPGVTGTTIRLALMSDPTRDRGFSAGVHLWMRTVNADGGLCGRSVMLVSATGTTGYVDQATDVLGFLAEPATDGSSSVAELAAADQIPLLQATGSSATLTDRQPVIVGPTDDIIAANALSYLVSSGRVAPRTTIGVLSDGGPEAENALAGAQWWAGHNGVTLTVRPSTGDAAFTGAAAVLVLAGPSVVARALAAGQGPVLTGIDGYAPSSVSADAADRLLVMLATPAFGSDQPAAAAVSEAAFAAGLTDPGPRLLSGYAVGTSWARLIQRACIDLNLTRAGVGAAMITIGPAPVDSLLGPSDPGQVVTSHVPATRQSSLAQADPSAPGALKPLVWLISAPGINDYAPPS